MDDKMSINGTKGLNELSSEKVMYDSIIQVPEKDVSSPSYTMPGVLHFLQSEWAKMESERGLWEIERAELQARIAFLQGERKGQENLKQDLVRRIKMLEYALKQERLKFQRWKQGESVSRDKEDDGKPSDEEEPEESEYDPAVVLARTTQQVAASNAKWKESRNKLRQYLQEVGFTDTVVDARQTRLRELMGGIPSNVQYSSPATGLVNGGPIPHSSSLTAALVSRRGPMALQDRVMAGTGLHPSTDNSNNSTECVGVDGAEEEAEALENFNFLSGAGDDDDDEDGTAMRSEDDKVSGADVDDESALSEFDILVPSSTIPSKKDAPDLDVHGFDVEPEEEEDIEWNSPETLMRKLKSGPGAGKRATLRAMLASLKAGNEDVSVVGTDGVDGVGAVGSDGSPLSGATTSGDTVGRKKSSSSLSTPQDWQHLDGLGDLAMLTVTNEAEEELRGREARADRPSPDLANSAASKSPVRRTWSVRYALRSHFDAVRALAFHPTEPCLISASEDGTLKLWSVKVPPPGAAAGAKKAVGGGPGSDVEPCYTFRGHDSPVLCVRFAPNGRRAFSSDLEGHVREWHIPERLTVVVDPDTGSPGIEEGVDLYEPFEMGAVHGRGWQAGSCAIWDLAIRGDRLFSCSADGMLCIWSIARDEEEEAAPQLLDEMDVRSEGSDERPTCFVLLPVEAEVEEKTLPHVLVGFTSGIVRYIDLENKKILLTLDTSSEEEESKNKIDSPVHCIAVHPLTTSVIAVGYEDRRIRFFDLSLGKCLHSMVAHLDAVTCLDIDPSGLYLLSGSHDCSLRIWNFETKACIQEITSHRKKFDESIHAVAFHSCRALMASGGADATARVFFS